MVRVEDGRIRLAAAAVGVTACALIAAAGASGAPSISGADGDHWNGAPSYSVTLDGADWLRWRLDDGRTTVVTNPPDPTPILLPVDLEERAWTLTVEQRSGTVSRTFVVDRTAPPAVTLAGPASVVSGQSATFTWTGGEPAARYTWRVDGAGGTVLPAAETTMPTATVAPLAAGSYSIVVVQTDAAGNAAPEARAALTVTAPPPVVVQAPPPPPAVPALPLPRPPATVTIRLPSSHAGRLRPRRAAVVRTVRPMLRWRGAPKGTTLYNVQIFRVDSRRAASANAVTLRKLRSVFPRTNHLRAPRLQRGACYVWRVWPYRDADFTKRPLGVSNFCVASARRRAPA